MKLLFIYFTLFLASHILQAQSEGYQLYLDELPDRGVIVNYAYELTTDSILISKINFGIQPENSYQRYVIPALQVINREGSVLREINPIPDSLYCVRESIFKLNKKFVGIYGCLSKGKNKCILMIQFDKELNILKSSIVRKIPYTPDKQEVNPQIRVSNLTTEAIVAVQFLPEGNISLFRINGNIDIEDHFFINDGDSLSLGFITGIAYNKFNKKITLFKDTFEELVFDYELNLLRTVTYPEYPMKSQVGYEGADYTAITPDRYLYFGVVYELPITTENVYNIGLCVLDTNYYAVASDTTVFKNFAPYDFAELTAFNSRSFFATRNNHHIGFAFAVTFVRTPSPLILMHFDEKLKLLETNLFQKENTCLYIKSVTECTDGQFLIAGFGNNYPFNQMGLINPVFGFIIKLNANNKFPTTAIKDEKELEHLISLRGNPVRDELILENNGGARNNQVSVSGINGKVLLCDIDFSGEEVHIPVSGLSPGAYIYSITSPDGQVISGKFVKVE